MHVLSGNVVNWSSKGLVTHAAQTLLHKLIQSCVSSNSCDNQRS